jgi:protoporphyrinogen oxidase
MTDVMIVGGGVAGLVAARDCARIGLSVTVYEATDAVGGAVARHDVAGLTLDSGAESFAVRRGSVADFIAELGLTDDVVAPNPAGSWLHLPAEGNPTRSVSVPAPKTGVLGIPGSPLADDVRRAIGWRGAWRAYADRLIPVLKIGREHSLGALVEKRMGRRVLERLVEPVASGVYSAPAVDLDLDVVAPGLNTALTTTGSLSGAVLSLRAQAPAGSAVGGLRGGMSRLVDALVADLDRYGVQIVTGARVRTLALGGTEGSPMWTATVTGSTEPAGGSAAAPHSEATAATTTTATARFVVIATPGIHAIELLGGLGELGDKTAALPGLDWPEPTVVELATLVLDAPQLDSHPRGTGVLVAATTPGVSAKALTHVSAKWEWVAAAAGPGRHVIRLSYGRAGSRNPSAGLSDAELRALALHDASVMLGVDLPPEAVRGFARTIWRDALSPATIGAGGRVQAVRDAVAEIAGLEVTGAWLSGTGLASVIPDARGAASRIRRSSLGL